MNGKKNKDVTKKCCSNCQREFKEKCVAGMAGFKCIDRSQWKVK